MLPNLSQSVIIRGFADPLLRAEGGYAEAGQLPFLDLLLPPVQLNLFLDLGDGPGSLGSLGGGDLFCLSVHAIFLRYSFVRCNRLHLEFVGLLFTSTNSNWSALYYYTRVLDGGGGAGLFGAYF